MSETLRGGLENALYRITDGKLGKPKDITQFSEGKLKEIAGRGIISGIYSIETVRNAFLKAGFSPDDADTQAKSRVITLD